MIVSILTAIAVFSTIGALLTGIKEIHNNSKYHVGSVFWAISASIQWAFVINLFNQN